MSAVARPIVAFDSEEAFQSTAATGGSAIGTKRKAQEEAVSETTSAGSASEPEGEESSEPAESLPEGPKPAKAYKSNAFLSSPTARMVRVACEMEEPKQRLEEEGIHNVVMFFGSARARPREQYEVSVREAEAKAAADPSDAAAQGALARLRKQAFLVPMFDATRELARMLTEWSDQRTSQGKPSYVVGSGGGPGMMEAANEGAYKAGGKSVGFGISLPFEDRLNPWVTPELAFEFHYFFTRKFWMSYKCMGLVVAPGGLGTCDELFEVITLMQTGKIKRKLPVILLGKQFWRDCIQWEAFVEYGMISQGDADQLIFADTAEEAFPHLIAGIQRLEEEQAISGSGE